MTTISTIRSPCGPLPHVFGPGRWWITATVILFTAAFGVVAFVMTPIYRTATVLSPRVSGVRK